MNPERAIEVLVQLIRDHGYQALPAEYLGTPEEEEAIAYLMHAFVWEDAEFLDRLEKALEAMVQGG